MSCAVESKDSVGLPPPRSDGAPACISRAWCQVRDTCHMSAYFRRQGFKTQGSAHLLGEARSPDAARGAVCQEAPRRRSAPWNSTYGVGGVVVLDTQHMPLEQTRR